MTTTAADAQKSGGIGKDLIVYVCLLALAGLQFVIAYQNIDVSQMFVRMLASHASRLGWRNCSSCIFGRKSVSFFGLSSSLRFPSCWGCSMGGPTVSVWLTARHFQNDSCSGKTRVGRRDVKRDVPKNDEGRETASPYCYYAGWTGPARRPTSGLLPKLRALLYAGGLRRWSNDSGLAQWDSDSHRPSHADVGWHDFHCASQT